MNESTFSIDYVAHFVAKFSSWTNVCGFLIIVKRMKTTPPSSETIQAEYLKEPKQLKSFITKSTNSQFIYGQLFLRKFETSVYNNKIYKWTFLERGMGWNIQSLFCNQIQQLNNENGWSIIRKKNYNSTLWCQSV